MDLLNKLTIKNLKLNKKRTIVTIIGIILSTALITAVASMFFSAKASLIKFEIREKGNYHYSFFDVPTENIKDFELNKKIEKITLVKNLGYAKLDGIKNEYKPYVYVKAYSKEAYKNLSINLLEGRLPKNSDEIIIPKHLKTNGKLSLKVGQKITLNIGNRTINGIKLNQYNPYDLEQQEKITNQTTKTYKIVGIMERPSTELEPYTAPGYTCITLLNNEELKENVDIYVRYTKEGEKNYLNTTANILEVDEKTYVKVHNPKGTAWNSIEEMNKAIEKVSNTKYSYSSNDYLITLETGITGNSTLHVLGSAAILVIAIIIITSIFCIKNSFDISITEKIRQYGMLSSIGATKKQIKKNVYYEALILGSIGIPIGIIMGILASYILIIISNLLIKEILKFNLIYKFSWLSIVFTTILSLITLLLSARKSAIRASKITPITAIRNSENIKIKKKKRKITKLIKKIFGVGGEIAYKNLERSKKKYRTTVVSIAFCVTVFIALSSFVNFAFELVKVEYESMNYNISVSYKSSEKENISNEIKEVINLENLNDSASLATTRLTIETDKYTSEYLKNNPHIKNEIDNFNKNNDSIQIIVLDNDSFNKYAKRIGLDKDKVKNKAIFKNKIYDLQYTQDGTNKRIELEKFTFKKGDIISGNCYDYHVYSKEDGYKLLSSFEIEIAAITEEVPIGLSENSFETFLIISENQAENIISPSTYQYIYIDSNNPDKTQEQLNDIFKDKNINIINNAHEAKMMNSFFTLIAIFLYGFITVIALIGITNIFNTITTNMNLRKREFAMLKSIGMTKKEFNRMIRLESIFYGTKALIFSIPLGILISYGIYLVLSDGEIIMKFTPPIMAIILSIIAVFLLLFVIMKYSINKINKQNTIDTIRNENI